MIALLKHSSRTTPMRTVNGKALPSAEEKLPSVQPTIPNSLLKFSGGRSYIEKPILVLTQLTAMITWKPAKDSNLLVRGSLVTAIAKLTIDAKCQCGVH